MTEKLRNAFGTSQETGRRHPKKAFCLPTFYEQLSGEYSKSNIQTIRYHIRIAWRFFSEQQSFEQKKREDPNRSVEGTEVVAAN